MSAGGMLNYLVLILGLCLEPLEAGFKVEVELYSYVSSKHILRNGFCCDLSSSRSSCEDDCDNKFTFCLRPLGSEGPGCPRNTTVYETVSIISDHEEFSRGQEIDDGVSNPLVFYGDEKWPGTMEFFVRIEDVDLSADYDGSTIDPLINMFTILVDRSTAGTSPVIYRDVQHGSVLRLSHQISCMTSYYGDDCGTYCQPRDDDTGHFVCGTQGAIECLPGYQNPYSNCTECSLAPGCSMSGGYCNYTHHCICREKFSGDNCEKCVRGYSGVNCTECDRHYAGENCSVCSERHTGHDCSECIQGFTGEDCGKCEDGYRFSGSSCVKCKSNYAGRNCSRCAPGFSGENCSLCVTGYTGINCSTCVEGYGGAYCTKCPAGFTGQNCSSCLLGYFGKDCQRNLANSGNSSSITNGTNHTSCCHGDNNKDSSGTGNCTMCDDNDDMLSDNTNATRSSANECRGMEGCAKLCQDNPLSVNCSECVERYKTINCTEEMSCRLRNGSSLCQNKGICKVYNSSFPASSSYCICPPGFKGEFCEQEVTGCNPNPCRNLGTCQIIGHSGEVKCLCSGDFYGRLCESTHKKKQIDFFFPFIGTCIFVGVLLLVISIIIITFVCCLKKKRKKELRSSTENSIPAGDASGYLIRSLKPFNSSSELDESVPGLVKISARKSELFDNPIYDRPSLEISGLVSSTEMENYPSKTKDELYLTTLESIEQSGSHNYSYNERSYDSFRDLHGQSQNKREGHHNYDKVRIHLDKNLKEVESSVNTRKEKQGCKAEEESMLTVVNASYEALPCHTPKMAGQKPMVPNILLATGQISDYQAIPDITLMPPPEVPRKKTVGFKPKVVAVSEHAEISTAKSPSGKKTKK